MNLNKPYYLLGGTEHLQVRLDHLSLTQQLMAVITSEDKNTLEKAKINGKNYNLIHPSRIILLRQLIDEGEVKGTDFARKKSKLEYKKFQSGLDGYLLPLCEAGIVKKEWRIPPPIKKGKRIKKFESKSRYYSLEQNEIAFSLINSLLNTYFQKHRSFRKFDLLKTHYAQLIKKNHPTEYKAIVNGCLKNRQCVLEFENQINTLELEQIKKEIKKINGGEKEA